MPSFLNTFVPLLHVRRYGAWQRIRLGSLVTLMSYRPQPARFVGLKSEYIAGYVYEKVKMLLLLLHSHRNKCERCKQSLFPPGSPHDRNRKVQHGVQCHVSSGNDDRSGSPPQRSGRQRENFLGSGPGRAGEMLLAKQHHPRRSSGSVGHHCTVYRENSCISRRHDHRTSS